MIASIVLEFENITKFPLLKFFQEYENFMNTSYAEIDKYFSGKTETIDNVHIRALNKLTTETFDLLSQFKNFANKFSKCGYWELMDFITTLNDTLEKINKLPKFRKTVLTKRGYTPNIETQSSVGSLRTIDDVAKAVSDNNDDTTSWIDLMLNNDWDENDWDIDKLSGVKVYVNNTVDVVVDSVIDVPIGERVYGIDIFRKLTFQDNDLKLIKYKENVEQKCDILLELNKGDVPEDVNFGKDLQLTASSFKSFSYPELGLQISDNFRHNDLFLSAGIKNVAFEDDNAIVTVNVQTKYDYNTEKKIVV